MGEQPPKAVILVVDDEAEILSYVETVLSQAGYDVLTAGSAVEAMNQIRQREGSVSLLLTDVVMPDLNGPNLADILLRETPSLRVLFISGWEPQVIEHEGALRRGFRTLAKPFTPAQLLAEVDSALTKTVYRASRP
jgi:two-component system, cell cycle sensor histidine kinase and response regulator CckA